MVRRAVEHSGPATAADSVHAGELHVDTRVEQGVQDRLAVADLDCSARARQFDGEALVVGGHDPAVGLEPFVVHTFLVEIGGGGDEVVQEGRRAAAVQVTVLGCRGDDLADRHPSSLGLLRETEPQPLVLRVQLRELGQGMRPLVLSARRSAVPTRRRAAPAVESWTGSG
jgi:hypothetical protein